MRRARGRHPPQVGLGRQTAPGRGAGPMGAQQKSPGPLRGPFATQGRSYRTVPVPYSTTLKHCPAWYSENPDS